MLVGVGDWMRGADASTLPGKSDEVSEPGARSDRHVALFRLYRQLPAKAGRQSAIPDASYQFSAFYIDHDFVTAQKR